MSSAIALAKLDSPALTGTPTAPTPTVGDNSTKVATTAFVQTTIPSWAKATTKPSYTLNEVCPETDNWLGRPGTTIAGKSIKVLAKTVNGVIEGGMTVTGSSNNDNNTTKYRYGGVTVTRSGVATDYLFDSSQSGIARLVDIYAAVQQIATDFTAKAYVVNELCTFNGVIYRCKSAYTATASSPKPNSDTTQWEAKKVSELFLPLTGGEMTGPLNTSAVIIRSYGKTFAIGTVSGKLTISDWAGGDVIIPNVDLNTSNTLALLQNLAPDFSTSATYTVGKLCVYDKKLYRCTTAVETAGEWTGSTNWTAATVQDVLALLAPLDSPAFTGTPTAPTPTAGDNSTRIATTAFVQSKTRYSLPHLTGGWDGVTPPGGNTVSRYSLSSSTATLNVATSATFRTGAILDFIVDVQNLTSSQATINFGGLGSDWYAVVDEGDDLTDMTTLAGDEIARFYFTQTAFTKSGKPVMMIAKQVVTEVQSGGGSYQLETDGTVTTEGELNTDGTLTVEGELNADGTLTVEAL